MEEEKDKGKYKSLIIAGIIAVLVITAFVFAIVKLISKDDEPGPELHGATVTQSPLKTAEEGSSDGKELTVPYEDETKVTRDDDGIKVYQHGVQSSEVMGADRTVTADEGLELTEELLSQSETSDPMGDREPIVTVEYEDFLKFTDEFSAAVYEVCDKTGVDFSVLYLFGCEMSFYGALDTAKELNNLYRIKDDENGIFEYVDYVDFLGSVVGDDGFFKKYGSYYDSIYDFARYIMSITNQTDNARAIITALGADGYIPRSRVEDYYMESLIYSDIRQPRTEDEKMIDGLLDLAGDEEFMSLLED